MQRGTMQVAKKWEGQGDTAPVLRTTVQEQIYQRLKDLILSGEIKPGQSLTIPLVAETFGVSHMPVREALHRLVAERALTTISGRSVGVPPLSLAKLDELRRVRIEIEGFAAEWAAERMTARKLDQLDDLVEAMRAAIEADDVSAFLRRNRDFHFAIYAATGSETLLSTIESLWFQIAPYLSILYPYGDYPRSNREHGVIARALRKGDGKAARAGVGEDIAGAAEGLKLALQRAQMQVSADDPPRPPS